MPPLVPMTESDPAVPTKIPRQNPIDRSAESLGVTDTPSVAPKRRSNESVANGIIEAGK